MKRDQEMTLARAEFAKVCRAAYPVAHGTLSLVRKTCAKEDCRLCRSGEGHPAWTFTFRKDGKFRCMHVRECHVEALRKAIENGRRLEAMILDEGVAYLERLRTEA